MTTTHAPIGNPPRDEGGGGIDPAATATTYQKARLRLGVAGVGTGVVLAAATLAVVLGGGAARLGTGPGVAVGMTAVLAVVMGGFQLALDGVGWRLDERFGLTAGDAGAAARERWVEAGRWVVAFTAGGAVVAGVVSLAGNPWPWVLLALAGVGVIVPLVRPPAPRGGAVPVDPDWAAGVGDALSRAGLTTPRLTAVDIGETTLAGGGLGGGVVWVSRAVLGLPPEVAATLVAREIGHARLRHRPVNAALSFVVLASAIGLTFVLLRAAGGGLATYAPAVVLALSAVVTLCSFAGLFLLPSLGRSQVLAVDRFVARHFGVAAARAMLDALAAANLPDDALGPVKAYVFHPIPPISARREHVDATRPVAAGRDRPNSRGRGNMESDDPRPLALNPRPDAVPRPPAPRRASSPRASRTHRPAAGERRPPDPRRIPPPLRGHAAGHAGGVD